MNLNHIDLQVSDVQATVRFFERCLGFTLGTSRTSPALAVLTNEPHDFTLVLQRTKSERPPAYPEGFHVGCLVGSVEEVIAFQERARADGWNASDVQVNGRGTMVYCQAGDVLVEVSCRRQRRETRTETRPDQPV